MKSIIYLPAILLAASAAAAPLLGIREPTSLVPRGITEWPSAPKTDDSGWNAVPKVSARSAKPPARISPGRRSNSWDRVGNPEGDTQWSKRNENPHGDTQWSKRNENPDGDTQWSKRNDNSEGDDRWGKRSDSSWGRAVAPREITGWGKRVNGTNTRRNPGYTNRGVP